jgi:hypothetical protein
MRGNRFFVPRRKPKLLGHLATQKRVAWDTPFWGPAVARTTAGYLGYIPNAFSQSVGSLGLM